METSKGIGLVRIQLTNVGTTKAIKADLLPGVNIFQGNNGAGKSTILNSIRMALTGKKGIPADIIRHGVDEKGKALRAGVVLNTTDFDVTLDIYKDAKGGQKHKLVVRKDGFKRDAPIEFIDTMAKEWNDPKEIADMPGKKFYDILMQYAHIDLSGFDTKVATIKEDQSYLRKQKVELGILEPVEKADRVDLESVMNTIAEIEEFNNTQRNASAAIDERNTRLHELENKGITIDDQIKELQREKELLSERMKVVESGRDALPKPMALKDAEPVRKQISEITEINKNADKYAQFVEWETKLSEMAEKFENNKSEIAAQEKLKNDAVKNAEMPVECLSITEDGMVICNGINWDNCSESDRLVISAQLIINTTPENSIRYMVIHTGESILSERRKKLHELLINNDYTCLMQVASELKPDEAPGVFYIVEGEIC